ncbi:hypothetical protein [Kineobactrum salinum]|uniref:Uncharacterized protein n=1 Tax=Kineobactrum salinum TaxID=2708301 RepID=A0A6C0U2W0_9GAMM|nr:hypothetical protein [Kineobactrum salinum]QIB66510.1 hypothetical protein G3T16_15010 [Kineobactrum salinum]
MMAGAYAPAYWLWSARTQAKAELALYYFAFFLALVSAGWRHIGRSYRYLELDVMSPANNI